MDTSLPKRDYQASGSDVYPIKSSSKMHDKIAWPVADKMLDMISQNIVPSGFDSAGFVKNSFVETFGKGLHQVPACSASERNTLGPLAKRKRCSIVDSALGMMGYDSLKVCDTKGRLLVDMLTALLQSKSLCGPVSGYLAGLEGPNSSLRSRKFRGQFCSQRMSLDTLLPLVDSCKSFFASVKDDVTQIQEVMDALVKVATDTCSLAPRAESICGVFVKAIYENEGQSRKDEMWVLRSVIDFALEQQRSIYSKLRPCSRLRLWRIRPSCLKQDISGLAHEAMMRLLLPIDRELCQRDEWAILVVCLSLAPEMFMEARRLLHHWFLSSGAVRLWQLRAELVAAVWDVVSHPSVWGLKNDIHLPPKFSFYSVVLRPFVQILEEPPTTLGVIRLLKLLDDAEKLRLQAVTDTRGGQAPLQQSLNHVDQNSIWSLLIESFPWLLFAFKLMFRNLNSTGISGGELYESEVYSVKLEGVPFDSEYGPEHLHSQIAARYLAWIISPANRSQRASDAQMLRMLYRSWVKYQECSSHVTSTRLSGQHEYGALTAAVEASRMKCTRCGSPVKEVSTLTDADLDGLCGEEKNLSDKCAVKSPLNLNLWLANIQRNFERNVKTYSGEEECGGREGASRIVRPPTSNRAGKCVNFMVHYLPLAALSEALHICNVDTLISILQFVASCGAHRAHTNEHKVDHKSEGQFPLICNSCEAFPPNERRCSQSTEKQSSCPAASSHGSPKVESRLQPRMSVDWIPGVSAVLSILDSLDSDIILWKGSDPSIVDPLGDKRRVTDNLVLIVAEFVREWGRSLELHLSQVPSSSDESTTYNLTLQDLYSRFCRWVYNLSLTEEVSTVCNEIRELAMRKKNVTSSSVTS